MGSYFVSDEVFGIRTPADISQGTIGICTHPQLFDRESAFSVLHCKDLSTKLELEINDAYPRLFISLHSIQQVCSEADQNRFETLIGYGNIPPCYSMKSGSQDAIGDSAKVGSSKTGKSSQCLPIKLAARFVERIRRETWP